MPKLVIVEVSRDEDPTRNRREASLPRNEKQNGFGRQDNFGRQENFGGSNLLLSNPGPQQQQQFFGQKSQRPSYQDSGEQYRNHIPRYRFDYEVKDEYTQNYQVNLPDGFAN